MWGLAHLLTAQYHSPLAALSQRLPYPVDPVETAALNGDMLEAEAFAFLATRVLRGLPTSAPGTTGVPAAIGGGKISRPTGASPR
mgnify:CR=1 FL=1